MGTPRVSGRKKITKMSAIVCHAPKKMNTPYFMVHIIIKNTCKHDLLLTNAAVSC